MKFETTPTFERDWGRLPSEHRKLFKAVIRDRFVRACDAYVANPAKPWPRTLRVEVLTQTRTSEPIRAMTWSFSGPDGRATFQFVHVDGEMRCRWRRIGRHEIYHAP